MPGISVMALSQPGHETIHFTLHIGFMRRLAPASSAAFWTLPYRSSVETRA
jgi:hypothetical protein